MIFGLVTTMNGSARNALTRCATRTGSSVCRYCAVRCNRFKIVFSIFFIIFETYDIINFIWDFASVEKGSGLEPNGFFFCCLVNIMIAVVLGRDFFTHLTFVLIITAYGIGPFWDDVVTSWSTNDRGSSFYLKK